MAAKDVVKSLRDWSGVATLVLAVVAIATWVFALRDQTLDAKLGAIESKIDGLKAQSDKMEETLLEVCANNVVVATQFEALTKLVGEIDIETRGQTVRLNHLNDRLREITIPKYVNKDR